MNWTELANGPWGREAAIIGGDVARFGLPQETIFAAIVAACGPFKRGMRFHTLPEARFYTGRQRLPSPGALFPDDNDRDLDTYVRRLQESIGDSFYLKVIEPLFIHYPLWAGVRDLLAGLWKHVGFPVLPVASELVLAGDFERRDDVDNAHATVLLVLSGRLRVHAADGVVSDAGTGDLLYWPPGDDRRSLEYRQRCLTLRLRVPIDSRLAVRAAFDEYGTLLQPDPDEPVPYLPPPPQSSGPLETLPHLRRFAALISAPTDEADAARADAALWAGRVSASGLEPLPELAPVPALTPQQRVRPAAPIITCPLDDDGTHLWAVNGQVFSVGGGEALELLGRLRDGTHHRVAELCHDEDGDDNGAAPLLDRLHELGGIELVEEAAT